MVAHVGTNLQIFIQNKYYLFNLRTLIEINLDACHISIEVPGFTASCVVLHATFSIN